MSDRTGAKPRAPTSVAITIKIRERAERIGDAGVEQIEISDWMPDYPGQSGEQKAQDLKTIRKDDALSVP